MLHRDLSSALLAASLLLPSVCLPAQTAPSATPPPHSHRELPKPTNLQVLPKDIAPADLLATMHQFTGALGEHCTFCHVQDVTSHRMDFASDAKPEKAAARVMMRMTTDLNGKYLAELPEHDDMAKVSCGTCHRGHSTPPGFTPPPEEHHGPPMPPPPPPLSK